MMFKIIIKIGLFLAIVFWAGSAQAETYRVKSGDTLGNIAAKHGVSVSRLKAWNGLKNDRIYVGQKLQINQIGSAQAETYRVKSGDTLTKIAAKYGTSVSRLKAWNGLKKDHIYVGQKLQIRPTQSTAESKNYTIRRDYYTVRKGDNLSKIAARSHTTVKNLIQLNRLKSTVVQPGQRLLIRTRKVAIKPRSATYPNTPPLIEPKPIIEGELNFYTVKEGETLEIIAQQYGLAPEEIREANLMPEESEVKKGQILAIPQEDTTE
ncbi:MAG: LysM peptidoglycan-binding domain-containing protein [Candidatus Omnitrophota bacterium]